MAKSPPTPAGHTNESKDDLMAELPPPRDDLEGRAPDPGFDLRQGLKVLVVVVTVMVVITLICVWLARP